MKIPHVRRFMAGLSAMALLGGLTTAAVAHDDVPLLNAAGAPVAANEPYSPKQTCGSCHNYGSDPATITHTQGVLDATNSVYWQSYDVAFFDHGVSKGRHSNQGRNEAYSTEMRTVFGDPFFTSSPGMFGKY
ncbi:MAG: hypothetical protein ABFS09_13920 [Thermodesulfobacteriota bacterium]